MESSNSKSHNTNGLGRSEKLKDLQRTLRIKNAFRKMKEQQILESIKRVEPKKKKPNIQLENIYDPTIFENGFTRYDIVELNSDGEDVQESVIVGHEGRSKDPVSDSSDSDESSSDPAWNAKELAKKKGQKVKRKYKKRSKKKLKIKKDRGAVGRQWDVENNEEDDNLSDLEECQVIIRDPEEPECVLQDPELTGIVIEDPVEKPKHPGKTRRKVIPLREDTRHFGDQFQDPEDELEDPDSELKDPVENYLSSNQYHSNNQDPTNNSNNDPLRSNQSPSNHHTDLKDEPFNDALIPDVQIKEEPNDYDADSQDFNSFDPTDYLKVEPQDDFDFNSLGIELPPGFLPPRLPRVEDILPPGATYEPLKLKHNFKRKRKDIDEALGKIRTAKKSHAGGLECDICGKKFSYYRSFKQHQNDHRAAAYMAKGSIGEVMCAICRKMIKPAAMDYHMNYRHSEERKFQCGICGKRFKSPGAMRHHENTQHKVEDDCFICGECNESFDDAEQLDKHIRTSHCECCFSKI